MDDFTGVEGVERQKRERNVSVVFVATDGRIIRPNPHGNQTQNVTAAGRSYELEKEFWSLECCTPLDG